MLFAQAREGNFPKALAATSPRRRVPTLAIAITASCTFIAIGRFLGAAVPNGLQLQERHALIGDVRGLGMMLGLEEL